MLFWKRIKRLLEALFVAREPVRVTRNGSNVSMVAMVKDVKQKGALTREEALDKQRQVLSMIDSSKFGVKISAAARLMLEGAPREAIEAYELIALAHPDRIGDCQAGIGAAHYFLGNYDRAIVYYELARSNGADPGMMQDNIDEARAAIADRAREQAKR